MFGFKLFFTTVIAICIVQNLHAQQHHNAWLRSTLSMPVSSKIKLDIEFQHRRQNGFENSNLISRNLLFSYRNWINYQLNNNVKLSLSPFAYFANYKIIEQSADAAVDPKNEIRFSAAVDLQQELFNKFYLVARTAGEYRIIEKQANITRLRNRLGTVYDLNEKLKLGFYDELLLNIHGTIINHFFDHNRIALSLSYQLSTDLKIETDYMRISRLPISSQVKLQESNLLFYCTYNLRIKK